jgi:hypothetical protein
LVEREQSFIRRKIVKDERIWQKLLKFRRFTIVGECR